MSEPLNDAPVTSVSRLIALSPQPITVFTLSWCSYCHAVRKLLDELELPYHVIELDTGHFRESVLNQRLRAELLELTQSNTLPQVFIGADNVGGYTDTRRALQDGQLASLLSGCGVSLPASPTTED